MCVLSDRQLKNSVDAKNMKHGQNIPYGAGARITSGCSKRPSGKTAPESEIRHSSFVKRELIIMHYVIGLPD
jgi:hypothetical protein